MRQWRYGDPLKHGLPLDVERFASKVLQGEDDECWEWQGGRDSAGYGRFFPLDRKTAFVMTHRYAWRLENPDAPEPPMVLHSCDNPPCCNRKHLRSGTAQDNMDDKMKRGRWSRGQKVALPGS